MPTNPADRLAQIEARAEKATKGPWEVHDYNQLRNDDEADPWLGVIRGAFEILTERFQVGRVKYSALPATENVANAEFIAHAREDIPWLLAELRTLPVLERENEQLRGEIDRLTQEPFRLASELSTVRAELRTLQQQLPRELCSVAAWIRTPGNIWSEDAIDECARVLENRAAALSAEREPNT